MTTHHGSCHCGKIAYQVDGEIDKVLDCNCSMCRRRGGLLWFAPRDNFRLTSAEGDYATYRFHKQDIAHHHCPDCGIAPFSEGAMPDGSPIVAINVRCLEDVDLDAIPVEKVDGKSL